MNKTILAEKNGYILIEDCVGYLIQFEGNDVKYNFHMSLLKDRSSEKYELKIASTSFGMHSTEDMKEVIKSYEAALEAAEYFKAVLIDNLDIEFA